METEKRIPISVILEPGPPDTQRGVIYFHYSKLDDQGREVGLDVPVAFAATGTPEDYERAAYLVKAANAHAALVDAVRTQLAALDGSPSDFARMLAAHRKLEAALKLATEDPLIRTGKETL
jgi:hypothetical protein